MSMVMSLPVLLVVDIVAVNTISEPSVVVLADRSMVMPESSLSKISPTALPLRMLTKGFEMELSVIVKSSVLSNKMSSVTFMGTFTI